VEKKHILCLFSDTGGGHRSAAEAIIEAFHLEYGERFTFDLVDFFKDYSPRPFNRFPELYPRMVKAPRLWGTSYFLSNGRRRASLMTGTSWPYVARSMQRLLKKHPADLILSVHALATAPTLRALGKLKDKTGRRPPYAVVVTDLVTTHALWYHRQADLTIVPTQPAFERALDCKLAPDKVQVVGLPVADRFCRPMEATEVLRSQLGWPQDRPMVLVVGGGDGMGPVAKTVQAIVDSGLNVGLAVIAGRNQALKIELESQDWPIPTFIYGFVRNMPDFMRAASVLVTKAGPGTICEALNIGLPMILYSRLPGQEDGNVTYVVEEGAGVWAPNPELIVKGLKQWLEAPDLLEQAVAACQRLARPQAARQIAHILAKQVEDA
jgi:1,2-diacylglycerol 3-beta-galactosyltransferase